MIPFAATVADDHLSALLIAARSPFVEPDQTADVFHGYQDTTPDYAIGHEVCAYLA
jgi:hypothetical protein